MNGYKEISKIGQGTFGSVYRYEMNKTRDFVAIKKMEMNDQCGISTSAIREIRILKMLKNRQIIELKDVFAENNSISLVLEYMPYDLAKLISSNYSFTDDQIGSFIFQIASALEFIHSKGLIHRDVKPGNLLVSKMGVLKIADFGLAREKSTCMSNRVCTLWYRAPELLLGDVYYDYTVDSWAIGCILVEMRAGHALFREKDEISQIKTIFSTMGRPNTRYPWDDIFGLDIYKKEDSWETICRQAFGCFLEGPLFEIASNLLILEKDRRISSKTLLSIPFIKKFKDILFPIEIETDSESNLSHYGK